MSNSIGYSNHTYKAKGSMRKILGATLLASLLTLTPFSGPAFGQEALWRPYYISAQSEYQKENYVASKSFLAAALKVAANPDEQLSTYFYLAHVCQKTGNIEEAEKYYKFLTDQLGVKTWGVLRPPDGTPDWDQTPPAPDLITDGTELLTTLKRGNSTILTMKLAKPITIVDVLTDYSALLIAQRRYRDAEDSLKQALTLADCRPDQAAAYETKVLQKLSILFGLEGKKAEEDAINKRLAILRNAAIPNFDLLVNKAIHSYDKLKSTNKGLAIRFNNLALYCAANGDYATAQALFQRSVSCLNDKPKSYRRERATILNNYSDLLLAMGQATDANGLVKQANMQLPKNQKKAKADNDESM